MAAEQNIYGSCEGPDSMYTKLISCDGHEFIVKRELALLSPTIKNMLEVPDQFLESQTNEVKFREITSLTLQKISHYLAYKKRYTDTSSEIPEFPTTVEEAYDLLMAGNFLDL